MKESRLIHLILAPGAAGTLKASQKAANKSIDPTLQTGTPRGTSANNVQPYSAATGTGYVGETPNQLAAAGIITANDAVSQNLANAAAIPTKIQVGWNADGTPAYGANTNRLSPQHVAQASQDLMMQRDVTAQQQKYDADVAAGNTPTYARPANFTAANNTVANQNTPDQSPYQRSAKAASDAEANARSQGVLDPAALAQIRSAAMNDMQTQMNSEQTQQNQAGQQGANYDASVSGGQTGTSRGAGAGTPLASNTGAAGGTQAKPSSLDMMFAGLSPEQQTAAAPLIAALKAQVAGFDAAAAGAGSSLAGDINVATNSRDAQRALIAQYTSDAKQDRADTEGYLKGVDDAAQLSLAQRESNEKQQLMWQQNAEVRGAEKEKAQQYEEMIATAALTGAAFSPNSMNAITKAEHDADMNIESLKQGYGFKMADVDMKYTDAYTAANQTFMKGLMDSAKTYRDDRSKLLGLSLSNEDAYAKAVQTADDKFYERNSALKLGKAAAITKAGEDVLTAYTAAKAAETAAKQWETDYNYKVDSGNRSYQFEYAKWKQEQSGTANAAILKEGELHYKIANDIRSAYNSGDKVISNFDASTSPAYQKFQAGLTALASGKDKATALDTLSTNYKILTGGATASGLTGGLSDIGMNFLASKKDSYSESDVPVMKAIAQKIFDNAKQQRDSRVTGLREELATQNLLIANPSLKVTNTQAGLPYTPPSTEAISNMMTLPEAKRSAVTDMQIGGTSYSAPTEMLTRMKAADDSYFSDYGKHLGFSVVPSDGGYGINIDPSQAGEAYDYMTGAGINTGGEETNPVPKDLSSTSLGNYIAQNNFRLTQGYGGTYDMQNGFSSVPHWGYDLAPPKPGEKDIPVPSLGGGTISFAGNNGPNDPYGDHIIVDDGKGNTILYGHLSSLGVKKGQKIGAGQDMGIMGSTGASTGIHVHIEGYKNSKPFDISNYS